MKVGIILDIIVVILFILSIWEGYKKGLTKSLLKIVSFVLAIVISIAIFKPVSELIINQTLIDDTIQEKIVSTFENENLDENEENEQSEIKKEKNSNIFYAYIEDKVTEVGDEAKGYVINAAAKEISNIAINVMVFIIVFIVTRIILIFIKALADLMTKIPVIKQCNELGGGIFGALRAIIIILILFTVLSIILPLIPNSAILSIINDSIICRFIYENNIIIQIIF